MPFVLFEFVEKRNKYFTKTSLSNKIKSTSVREKSSCLIIKIKGFIPPKKRFYLIFLWVFTKIIENLRKIEKIDIQKETETNR